MSCHKNNFRFILVGKGELQTLFHVPFLDTPYDLATDVPVLPCTQENRVSNVTAKPAFIRCIRINASAFTYTTLELNEIEDFLRSRERKPFRALLLPFSYEVMWKPLSLY